VLLRFFNEAKDKTSDCMCHLAFLPTQIIGDDVDVMELDQIFDFWIPTGGYLVIIKI